MAGCSQEPPKCSDEDTLALVRKIIADNLTEFKNLHGEADELSKKNFADNLKFEFPRASAFEKEIKKLTCESKLLAGGTYEVPIQYQSQLDDENRHIVSVYELEYADMFKINSAIEKSLKKTIADKKELDRKQLAARNAKILDEINLLNSTADKMYAEASDEEKELLNFFKTENEWVSPFYFCGSGGCDAESEKYVESLEKKGWSYVYARDQKGTSLNIDDDAFAYGRWIKK